MAVINTINVGGADYAIVDDYARRTADGAEESIRYRTIDPGAWYGYASQANKDNKYDFAMPKGHPFQWSSWNPSTIPAGYVDDWVCRGGMMKTTKAVTAGEMIIPGVNCEKQTISDHLDLISVYAGSDSKLHYRNWLGADSVINFSGGLTDLAKVAQADTAVDHTDLWYTDDKTLTVSGSYSGNLLFLFMCVSKTYENQQVSVSSHSGLSNVKSNIWMPQMGIATGTASGNFSFTSRFTSSSDKQCAIYVFK